ncbi:unnamed protein product, partial [Allacma fusca]
RQRNRFAQRKRPNLERIPPLYHEAAS